jgi:hypothetical protein
MPQRHRRSSGISTKGHEPVCWGIVSVAKDPVTSPKVRSFTSYPQWVRAFYSGGTSRLIFAEPQSGRSTCSLIGQAEPPAHSACAGDLGA